MTKHRRRREHHERHRRGRPIASLEGLLGVMKHRERIRKKRHESHPKHLHERFHPNPIKGVVGFLSEMAEVKQHPIQKTRRAKHYEKKRHSGGYTVQVLGIHKLPADHTGVKKKPPANFDWVPSAKPKPTHPMQAGVKIIPPHVHTNKLYKFDPTIPPFFRKKLKNWPPTGTHEIVNVGSVGGKGYIADPPKPPPLQYIPLKKPPVKKLPPPPKPPLPHRNPDPTPPHTNPPPPEETKKLPRKIQKPKNYNGGFSHLEHDVKKVSSKAS